MGWGSGVAVSCGVGRRHASDPAIQPLAWEPTSICCRSSPRKGNKTKKRKKKKIVRGKSTYLIFDLVGVLFVAQQLTNLTSIHKDEGLIPGLTQWVKDPVLL